MPEIAIDTNVLVSAFVFKGNPLRLFGLAVEGKVGVAISQPIIDETRRILWLKFGWPPGRIDAAEALISSFARRVVPSKTLRVVKDDATDDRIVECAVAAGSDYIVTGDKHSYVSDATRASRSFGLPTSSGRLRRRGNGNYDPPSLGLTTDQTKDRHHNIGLHGHPK